ncbi:MAG: peptide chain release factor 2 [Halanaerobiales bacterium]|nr:peptide chain release factor 2 [Halanaerobiales bacterium]
MYFDPEKLKAKRDELEEKMTAPDFWDDNEKATRISKKVDKIKNRINVLEEIKEDIDEIEVYIELADEEEGEDLLEQADNKIKKLKKRLDNLELKTRMNGEYDQNNAILSIHPGAGGTESQDWAEMLLRMYDRWAQNHDFEIQTLDFQSGDEAGIKRVTLMIKGEYAFGYLKGERGVHRLVRISPFDSSGRRHTSFASVDVLPEVEEDLDVDIDEQDLKMETFRASGAGGQHVNTTDSAVRITHQPTGVVVQCQNERSQHKNKQMAMKILKTRLMELKKEAQAEKIDELRGEYKEIAWGSQIRSYVFHPYNMIKDHRTDLEEGNTEKVMDGYIDEFIDAYLKQNNSGEINL